MKKLILAGLISLMATSVWAQSAPVNNSATETAVTSITVDSQWTGSWLYIDSNAILKTDTCYVRHSIVGTATLYQGDKLYIGMNILDIADASGQNVLAPTDTIILEWPVSSQAAPSKVFNFGFTIQDSLISTTDSTSKCFITAAVKSSSKADNVIITSLTLSAGLIIESR